MAKPLIFLALALTIAACNDGSDEHTGNAPLPPNTLPPIATIKDLKWLEGKWQNKSAEGIAFENWKITNDSTMAGVSGFINGRDTITQETISLEQRGTKLYYIPTVKNQNEGKPVSFELVETAADSFVFSNPQHDFPNKITYTKKTANTLLAKISGKINDTAREMLFPMQKVE
jgi:hypothetical protein